MLGSETISLALCLQISLPEAGHPAGMELCAAADSSSESFYVSLSVPDENPTGKSGVQEQAGTAGTGLSTPHCVPCPVLWKVLAALAALTACFKVFPFLICMFTSGNQVRLECNSA